MSHLSLTCRARCPGHSFLRRERLSLSGQIRNSVGGSGQVGGVAEVEAAGGVEGVFGGAGEVAGGQDGVFVPVFAGQVDREAPAGCGSAVSQPHQRLGVAVGQASSDVGERAAESDVDAGEFRPAFPGPGGQGLLQRRFR